MEFCQMKALTRILIKDLCLYLLDLEQVLSSLATIHTEFTLSLKILR